MGSCDEGRREQAADHRCETTPRPQQHDPCVLRCWEQRGSRPRQTGGHMTPRKETLADGIELYLGDCREILPTLGKVDLVVTDPPYSISTPGVARWEQRYGRTPDDLNFFAGDADWFGMTAKVCEAIRLATALLAAHGSLYIWCGHRQFGPLVDQLEDAGWTTRFLVWSKKHPVPPPPGAGWPSGAALCVY